ncbi:hypothetical protein JK635_07550 [Neobacillus sp. YIM B02564]|uniref:50S ribosomal protein L19 n=1 Tax=Neobacillus paridis TaxID=2803862 RepID=A0ABS1TN98_9BACI|nr:hypothetical protein [Neobacillus paridis]MBL4952063.1 hypothetical protein [Neobacillus paridis]
MKILLKSDPLKVVKIKKKTQAKMFKDLKVGDVIKMSIPVEAAGSNRGTYASHIQIQHTRTGEYVYKSFNEIAPILNRFELEPIA